MIIAGLLMTATGVYCFANMGRTWASFAFVLGIVLLIHGAGSVISYLIERKRSSTSSWMLAEGLLTLGIGALALFYEFQAALMITMAFGIWLAMTGILRLVAALEMKGPSSQRYLVCLFGIFAVLCGIYGIIHPYVFKLALAAVLGLIFLTDGVACIVTGAVMPSRRR
jgi:uncharacterized membrane protein HdeD (DUF308 family)